MSVDPPPTPGPALPPPSADAPGALVVAQIGEIAVTSTLVRTPAGDLPLAGSTWHVTEEWQPEQRTPTWAVVAAIVGFCVLPVLSLLFLKVRTTVYRGTAQVVVTNGPRQYVARVPVNGQARMRQLHQQVNYARSLAAL
ncbi:hypothetical protein SAMN05444365_11425 [Micromonospora pattaloongensis]|uniref:Uncharacterized protein n=1 Tax=Micromonospora pattaloongensis TaxID=405436 RepID=A0A1H3SUD9_9ACTN|nr:hypothetical protein [Micromonospora pattaloongensis]SDZ41317.1 hypothetical protein SAMN05444365_11425 [Micromonospora pattaloongensis]